MDHDRNRSPLAWVPLLLAAVVGAGATVAGAMLLLDPSGGTLGLPRSLLGATSFADYRIPGLLLFVAVGLFGLVAAAGLVLRARWAWPVGVTYGIVVVGWIAVQVVLLGYVSVLQPAVGLAGFAIVVSLTVPAVADAYDARRGLALLAGVDLDAA